MREVMQLTESETQQSLQGDQDNGFIGRHIGPDAEAIREMVQILGSESLDDLISWVIPDALRQRNPLKAFPNLSEEEALSRLRQIAAQNQLYRSYIGKGYVNAVTPTVIARNILENPAWYTQYTPYQPEISQGRLEALLNFQTMVGDLTGLPIANASLLDEGTAAAEAMTMLHGVTTAGERTSFYVSSDCHPQTIAVVRTRAEAQGWTVIEGNAEGNEASEDLKKCFGALIQYPNTFGEIKDYKNFISRAHQDGCLVIVAADILALTLLTPPGELGADVAVGCTQRFGVPMGCGGPHAAYLATKDEYKRQIPGRVVGVSKDRAGRPALRLALQTREQHIRREKATSNICTAQVLLAVMASMYAVFHGPKRLKELALRLVAMTSIVAKGAERAGLKRKNDTWFDTVSFQVDSALRTSILERAKKKKINFRIEKELLSVTLDESVTVTDLEDILFALTGNKEIPQEKCDLGIPKSLKRETPYLTHEVFNKYHSETEFIRYVKRLESKDLSLVHSMIPLGSCTMKLNATSEMLGVSWPQFASIHPFAPDDQQKGYKSLVKELERTLCDVTGFKKISFQPNAGSQGEFAGLVAIRAFQESNGEGKRNICLIPKSAHGTNPASAVMAGLTVVAVECDSNGNIDVRDLKEKAEQYKESLSCVMITYPSTHGVFEGEIKKITKIIHQAGGQVYMDGANLNAMVGLVRPAELGMDVCHLNLHKTFCIPHGGGGPGVGPVAVAGHLAPFIPEHVSSAPYGSALILTISWMYIQMMGSEGLKKASQVAILNANYIAKRLANHFPVVYKGQNGFVAHECILDLRRFKEIGVEVEDIAKRLMDYGFHAPTVSWPVAGTLMVEPTESESRAELDRFCDAMIAIRDEIRKVEEGEWKRDNNPLKNAPHTALDVVSDEWDRPYARELGGYPAPWTRQWKFWPAIGRIDAAYGDRNLICSCPSVEELAK